MKEKIGKSILAIVLLVLIVAFTGVDIYMYVIAGDSTKIQTYTGNAKKEEEQYEDEYEDEDYEEDVYTSTLKGFSTTGSVTASETTDTNAAMKNSSDFVLPKFSTKYYTKSDLKKLSKSEVRRAVNDIYALHGYIFTTDENMDYYSKMDWYQGTVTSMEDAEKDFNAYENANKDLIVEYEKKKGWR